MTDKTTTLPANMPQVHKDLYIRWHNEYIAIEKSGMNKAYLKVLGDSKHMLIKMYVEQNNNIGNDLLISI